jgi:hypothetical protein
MCVSSSSSSSSPSRCIVLYCISSSPSSLSSSSSNTQQHVHTRIGIHETAHFSHAQPKGCRFERGLHLFPTKVAQIAPPLGRTAIRLGPGQLFKRCLLIRTARFRFGLEQFQQSREFDGGFVARGRARGLPPTAGPSRTAVLFQYVQDADLTGGGGWCRCRCRCRCRFGICI